MKAVRIHEYGDVDVLRVEDAPRPVPGAGEVLVKVAATAYNAVDEKLRSGELARFYPLSFPYTPGLEFSGTVVQPGADVRDLTPGQAVVAFPALTVAGGAAEFAVVPAAALAPAPATVSLADAAALPIAALTADQALFELGGLRSGQRVLINGAGGAVGGMAIQLAKNAGATVLATAAPRSAAAVRAQGADELIDYTTAPVLDAVTGRVDLLINLVAGAPDDISRLTALVVDGGKAVSVVPMPLTGDEARGITWSTFNARADMSRLADLAAAVDKGELKLDISARYPFTELATVQTAGRTGQFRGKVLLTVED
nr:NADP-dependent oxidoreductase [uncultured Actinoplanes sp.]